MPLAYDILCEENIAPDEFARVAVCLSETPRFIQLLTTSQTHGKAIVAGANASVKTFKQFETLCTDWYEIIEGRRIKFRRNEKGVKQN